jgi:predicted HicB family RNase H-like nuclease
MATQAAPEKHIRASIFIPQSLHRDLKSAAALQGKTFAQYCLELIESAMKGK